MTGKNLRLVIIGGVAGGTSAASRARRTDKNMEITLYEKGDFVSYGACDEPYFISGEVPSWKNLLVREPEEFRTRQNIIINLGHEVTKIDPADKTVTVTAHHTGETFVSPFDRLIIATGAKPRPYNVPGANLPGIFQLKFIDQARSIKEYIENHHPRSAVIVGAGFIAMEMAEALTENNIKVTICHRGNLPGGNLEPEIGQDVADVLRENDVSYISECNVLEFVAGPSGKVANVHTDRGDFDADMVLLAVGVLPEVDIARKAGIILGPTGAIATDSRQETNIKGIFAAGDCCETIHRISGKPVFTPLGDIANKQGWAAGENAAGGDQRYNGSLGSMHFKCFDLEVGMTGLSAKEAQKQFDIITNTITHSSRAHAQPGKKPIRIKLVAEKSSGRILGGQIAGKEGAALRINSLATAIHNNMTAEQIAELDFAYAPPFSPVIDPILLAARVISKKI